MDMSAPATTATAMAMATEDTSPLMASLSMFELQHMDTLRHAVLGATQHQAMPSVDALVQHLRHYARTRLVLTTHEEKCLVRVVKEIARMVVHRVRAICTRPEEVNAFVHLDSDMLPLLELIDAAAGLVTNAHTSGAKRTEQHLFRWTPFAVYASAHFVCACLPAHDAMQSFEVANGIITKCQTLHAVSTRSELLALLVDRLVALSSYEISKEEWVAQHSIAKNVLQWVILQVPFPHLGGDVLGRLLAVVFPLMDDLTDATQRVGVAMLAHIVENVTATELRWYTDVLLEVLRVALTSRQPETLAPTLEALMVSLDKVSPPDDYQFYDRFVPRLLSDCSLCSDVALRVLYTRHLRRLVTRLGAPQSIYIIRFLQPLLKVLFASFEGVQAELILETLETLRSTVQCAWPRIPPHTEQIIVGVLKAVALCEVFDRGDISHLPSDAECKQILDICVDIITLLQGLHQEHDLVARLLQQVADQSSGLKPFCEQFLTT